MRRPNIKASLLAIFGGIALIAAGFGFLSSDGIEKMNNSTVAISQDWLPGVNMVGKLKLSIMAKRFAIAQHILATTTEGKKKAGESIVENRGKIADILDAYRKRTSSDREKVLVDQISTRVAAYDSSAEKLVALSTDNKNKEATAILNDTLLPAGAKTMAAVDELVAINMTGIDKAIEANQTVHNQVSLNSYMALALFGIAVSLGAFYGVSGIAGPVVRITKSMKMLADGDTAAAIPFAARTDEIGAMAGAVEIFREAAVANKRMEIEAESNRKRGEADRIADQLKAETDAAERLRIATSGLAVGLKRLASGDLAFQLEEAFAPDFEALRHDFNSSVKQLGDTLAAISTSISAIDDGTREIASGSSDLAKRTEQQAASLEETAAALDQITVNVSNSAKRSEEARSVATQANLGAAKSAEVVSHAVEAMSRIEASSQQISNIIGVIDEIAFQTNLLALNAGVEAARAGDAGRGFAVVAQEVRELAQRSAKAAKEIKGLIQNSSTEVESGVKLVRDTGGALKTIGGLITEINQHMDSIATSAKEQSVGLAEVNTAVNSMDQTTQQNAAMVEQTTAASASLAMEATKLRDLVMQFKLQGAASMQSTALRQTARAMAEPPRRSIPAQQPANQRKFAAVAGKQSASGAQGNWEEF